MLNTSNNGAATAELPSVVALDLPRTPMEPSAKLRGDKPVIARENMMKLEQLNASATVTA